MIADAVATVVGIVAVVNPIGAIPSFLALTETLDRRGRIAAARRAALTTAATLVVASLAGGPVLRAMGIGIPAFRVAGGILLLVVAVSRLDQRPAAAGTASPAGDVAVVPIGIPTLAGPGAISAVILHAQGAADPGGVAVLLGAALIAGGASWAALRLAQPIGRCVGAVGIGVAARLMSLLLAAVAVGFIADGATTLFPALRR